MPANQGFGELARQISLSSARVTQLVQAGVIRREPDGTFHPDRVIEQIRRQFPKTKAQRPAGAQTEGSSIQDKLRKAQLAERVAKAQRAQLDLRERSGELINYEKAMKLVGDVLLTVRDTILNAHQRFGPEIAGRLDIDPQQLSEEIRTMHRSMLADITNAGSRLKR